MNGVGVTGCKGYIGTALVEAGAIPLNCDVTKSADIERELEEKKPKFVFHLAAKSDVGFCETHQDEAWFVNCLGTLNVGNVCEKLKIPSALLSTYQIWNGGLFERHKEESRLSPSRNRYGMTKVIAESFAREYDMKVIRTSYVFDRFRLLNRIESLEAGTVFTEPAFLFRSFIYLKHFVELLQIYFVNYETMPDTLHLAGSLVVSWYNFMLTLCQVYGIDKDLVKGRYVEDRNNYPRPWNGGIDISRSVSLGFPTFDYKLGLLAMHREQR